MGQAPVPEPTSNGIVSTESRHTVEATLEKLQDILRHQGVKVFALIDHSGEAEKVGMPMRNTKLLIFGNPKAGTPSDAGVPNNSPGPAAEDPGLGRRRRQSLAHLQQRRISPAAAPTGA